MQSNRGGNTSNKKARIATNNDDDETNSGGRSKTNSSDSMNRKTATKSNKKDRNHSRSILLNGKIVDRPNYPTSYGILLYREIEKKSTTATITIQDKDVTSDHNDNDKTTRETKSGRKQFEYLLGLIPQGNAWTVFKGLPEDNERPEETAIREFEEETSFAVPIEDNINWEGEHEILYGVTSTKKLLQIYLIKALPSSVIDVSKFDINKVVKIEKGYWAGKPEIIHIQFMTKDQAIEGVSSGSTSTSCGCGSPRIVKIYKSQVSILERAETILQEQSLSSCT